MSLSDIYATQLVQTEKGNNDPCEYQHLVETTGWNKA